MQSSVYKLIFRFFLQLFSSQGWDLADNYQRKVQTFRPGGRTLSMSNLPLEATNCMYCALISEVDWVRGNWRTLGLLRSSIEQLCCWEQERLSCCIKGRFLFQDVCGFKESQPLWILGTVQYISWLNYQASSQLLTMGLYEVFKDSTLLKVARQSFGEGHVCHTNVGVGSTSPPPLLHVYW